MSDVFYLELMRTGSWVTVVTVILICYRRQLGGLLDSLGSVKIGGAAFTLGDRRKTAESYVLLAETLVDLLSLSSSVAQLSKAMTLPQVEKLGQFAQRYTAAVPTEDWNEEMLRNIAYLLHLFGRFEQSVHLFDSLLKARPEQVDFLDNKAFALLLSGVSQNVKKAEEIFIELTVRFPARYRNRLRLAYCKSVLGKHEEAIAEMEQAIELNGINEQPDCLLVDQFYSTRASLPDEYSRLASKLHDRISH